MGNRTWLLVGGQLLAIIAFVLVIWYIFPIIATASRVAGIPIWVIGVIVGLEVCGIWVFLSPRKSASLTDESEGTKRA